MSHIAASLKREVTLRAGSRCEYCTIAQAGQEATFHIDHVVPLREGGPTTLANLALACVSCSLRKGARIAAPDPETGEDAALFNPRLDAWADHFAWDGPHLVATSPTGRATAALLKLNRPSLVAIRNEESLLGRHPPT